MLLASQGMRVVISICCLKTRDKFPFMTLLHCPQIKGHVLYIRYLLPKNQGIYASLEAQKQRDQ